jgi:serine/threonine-protein kinase
MATMRMTRTILVLLVTATFSSPLSDRQALAQGAGADDIAAKARDILKKNCEKCHGDSATAGVNVLDHKGLLAGAVVAGKADASPLFQRITATDSNVMPPADEALPLSAEEIAIVKQWITAGAAEFPALDKEIGERGIGEEQILAFILQDVRRLPIADRKHARYFSITHRMNAGASKEELELERDALAKTINHLSWQPKLVKLIPVGTTRTIFRIDLRTLGWDKQPYKQVKGGKVVGNSTLNIFDLALLEYPYGRVGHASITNSLLVKEFLNHANQVRPIAYIRSDWFVSTVTLPPLYEDFLQLPRKLEDLEKLIGVDSKANIDNFKVIRAGSGVSGVSAHNRVIERHASKYGWYWKSYDFQSSLGRDNIFKEPVDLKPAGGEMIFALPNGLQGYMITDNVGNRIDFAPTSIVVDKNAADKTVRNGLSCMRCHNEGMIDYADKVRPTFIGVGGAAEAGMAVDTVLKLYPEQSKISEVIKQDGERFMAAMEELLGKPQGQKEPITLISERFLDSRLRRSDAGSELGMPDSKRLQNDILSIRMIKEGFAPLLAGGLIPRDAWEGNYERVVRGLRLAVPMVPLDGLTKADYAPSDTPPFNIEIKTNKSGNLFRDGEELVITVKPSKDVFIELIGTSASGRKVILAPATTKVKANTEFKFPAEGKPALKVKKGAGKDFVTVFASAAAFTEGQLLRGDGVADRLVHGVQVAAQGNGAQVKFSLNPFQAVKKTVAIEYR